MTTTSGVAAYLTVHNAAEAIAFYQQAFGATEVLRLDGPGGQIAHAEIEIAGQRRSTLAIRATSSRGENGFVT